MNERKRPDGRSSERRAAEGVRIIGAEEAQAALDAGHAAGRRAGDELRFGDVPPQPTGPRPPHRFPLPESIDPASAVPRPPVAPPRRAEDRPEPRPRPIDPDEAHDPRPWQERVARPPGSDVAAAPEPPAAIGPDDPTGRLFIPPSAGPDPDDRSAGQAWDAPVVDRPGAGGAPAGPDPLSSEVAGWDPGNGTPDPGTWDPGTWDPGRDAWATGAAGAGGADPAAGQAWDDPGAAGAAGWAPASTWAADPDLPAWQAPPDDPAVSDATVGLHVPRAADEPTADRSPAEEGITMSGGAGTELPHWTDPPTGEVPRILPDDPSGAASEDDDLAAWNALGSRGTRWREGDDWDEDDDFGAFADEETRVGALDPTRTEHSDLYSFDEDFERLEEERTGGHAATGADHGVAAPAPPRRARPEVRDPRVGRTGGGRRDDLASRVAVGVGLIVLLLIAYAVDPKALLVLGAVVVLAAAAEAYGMLQRSGFRPATLLGLVGSVALMFGAYWRGIEALPLGVVIVLGGSMLWYLLGIVEARPLANVAVTVMTFVWVGVLGSYGPLMLRAPHGSGLFLGAVATVVAADIGAFVVGRWVGSRPLAPNVSPAKTIEGFLGGLVLAILVGAVVGKELTPWGGGKHGLLLGLVIGLVAPIGDLFESMIKRDLSLKDSGGALGGHGGLLDRFDAVLLALPAAYYVAFWLNLVK